MLYNTGIGANCAEDPAGLSECLVCVGFVFGSLQTKGNFQE